MEIEHHEGHATESCFLCAGLLGLLNCVLKSCGSFVRKLVLLIQFRGLDDGLLHQISNDAQGGHPSSYQIIFIINLPDLRVGAREGTLDLLDRFGVGVFSCLDLIEGGLKLPLGLVEDLVLGIELGEVVEDFDRRLRDGREDLASLGVGFGRVVGRGGTDGTEDGASDGESDHPSEETGGELHGLFVDGNNRRGLLDGRGGLRRRGRSLVGHGQARRGAAERRRSEGRGGANEEGGDEELSVFHHGC
mmetsp:Transcript_28864/g.61258  ORF Transcript_28864/g.61258 Transcript_28864/m.61258 type:complete len:247 (+) Transcript_28864:283-1023(+)